MSVAAVAGLTMSAAVIGGVASGGAAAAPAAGQAVAHSASRATAPAPSSYWAPYTGHRGSPYYRWNVGFAAPMRVVPQVAVDGQGAVAFAISGANPQCSVFVALPTLTLPGSGACGLPQPLAGPVQPMPLLDQVPGFRTVHGVALNDAGQLAASFSTTTDGAVYDHLELLNQLLIPAAGSVAAADAGDPVVPPFAGLGGAFALNDAGNLAFTATAQQAAGPNVFTPAFLPPSSAPVACSGSAHQAASCYHRPPSPLASDGLDGLALDDAGDVLIPVTSGSPQQLWLYNQALTSGTELASTRSAGLACDPAGTVWARLGARPSISPDGTIVAFAAQAPSQPAGVYLCYRRTANAPWTLSPVAVAGGGRIDDFGYTAADAPIGAALDAADLNSSVDLVEESSTGAPTTPGLHPGQSVTVGFAASPACSPAPCPADPSVSHLIGAQRGIWAAEVVVQPAPDKSPTGEPTLEVRRPWPVLQCGDYVSGRNVAGQLRSYQVTSLDASSALPQEQACADTPLWFAMASHYTAGNATINDAGNHYVALAVQATTSAGAATCLVLRGDHTDLAGDGLVDAWKTDGIDFTGSGTPTITLPGANVDQKDLYLHVDSMSCGRTAPGCPGPPIPPLRRVIPTVVGLFATAPVANPWAGFGIHLTVEGGAGQHPTCTPSVSADCVPYQEFVQVSTSGALGNRVLRRNSIQSYENSYLDEEDKTCRGPTLATMLGVRIAIQRCIAEEAAKALAYRYVLFAGTRAGEPHNSGVTGESVVAAGGRGSYCVPHENPSLCSYWWGGPASAITTAQCPAALNRQCAAPLNVNEVDTMMHELGHTLGLQHGGGDSLDCKRVPVYPSVMNGAYTDAPSIGQVGSGQYALYTETAAPTELGRKAAPKCEGTAVWVDGKDHILYGYNDWASLQYAVTWGLASVPGGSFAPAPARPGTRSALVAADSQAEDVTSAAWWREWAGGDIAGDGVSNADSVCPFVYDPSQNPAACATTVSVTDASALEADAGTSSTVAFPVTIDGSPPTRPVTVHYATSDGTAEAGRDYVATSGTLTIPAGASSAVIDVPLIGQAAEQPSRAFTLTLSGAAGAGIFVPGTAVGSIVDDGAYISPTATAAGRAVLQPAHGVGVATIPVTLSNPSRDPVSVGYATADGTAAAGVDYTATAGTLTIPAGQTVGDITVPVLAAPGEAPPRTFYVRLSDPARVTLSASSVTVTLLTRGGPAAIAVITSPPVTAPASAAAVIGPLTVTEEDGFGAPAPAPAGGATVALSSTSATGVFSTGPAGPPVTSVTIPAGAASASFYYADTAVGTPAVSVAAAGLAGTSQSETITPGAPERLAITSHPVTGTTSGGAGLGPITVTEDDAYGNPAPAPAGGSTVFLASSSVSGVFAATAGGPLVTSVTIRAGSPSASFYYGDITAGSAEITVAAADLADATQAETVAAPPPPIGSCLHPTETWTGAAGNGNFDDPANWSAGVLPGATYSVCIPAVGGAPITGGIETVGSIETFTPLRLAGLTTGSATQTSSFHASTEIDGTLTLGGPTVVDGAGTVFTWTTDVESFDGTGSLQVNRPATVDLISQCVPDNGGCPEFSLPRLDIAAGATLGVEGSIAAVSSAITNAGTIAFSHDAVFGASPGGAAPPPTLANAGAIVQADGTASLINADLRLAGHVDVPSGTLTLSTTASESDSATFVVAAGAMLDLDAHLPATLTLTALVPFAGGGTLETGHGSGGGTVVVDGTFTLPALDVGNGTTLQLTASDPIPKLTVHSLGTLALAGNLVIPADGAADFDAGNLTGAGNLTIDAGAALTLDGSGGDFSGTGTITVDGTATVAGGAQPLLGQPLVNDGTLTLETTAGEPTILGCPATPAAGGSLTNDGTLLLTGDDSIFPFGYGCTLTNTAAGTITKTAGTPGGASTLGGLPVNAGAVNVDAGTLVWENDTGEGGVPAQTAVSSGAFTLGGAATLELWDRGTGIVLNPASEVTGTGTVQAADGTVAIDGELAVPAVTAVASTALTLGSGPLTLADLVIGGAASLDNAVGIVISAGGSASFDSAEQQELSGPGSLTIDTGAALALDGSGGLAGTGTITVEPGGTATVSGGAPQTLGQALVNDGTLTLAGSASGASSLGCPSYPAAGGGSLTNNGAVILAGDGSIFPFGYGCALTNTATGTISKTAGAPGGGSVLGGFPVNAGTVHVDVGALIWENDTGQSGAAAQTATSPGAFTVAAGAAVQLRGYAINLAPGSSLAGAGALVVSQTAGGSADTLAGVVTLPSLTVSDGAALALATASLPGTTLANDGTLTLPGQTVTLGGYAQAASGALDIPLSSSASFGAISASTASLSGQLTVFLPGAFGPPIGARFPVVTAADGVTGTFSVTAGPAGQAYTASYAGTSVTITRTG